MSSSTADQNLEPNTPGCATAEPEMFFWLLLWRMNQSKYDTIYQSGFFLHIKCLKQVLIYSSENTFVAIKSSSVQQEVCTRVCTRETCFNWNQEQPQSSELHHKNKSHVAEPLIPHPHVPICSFRLHRFSHPFWLSGPVGLSTKGPTVHTHIITSIQFYLHSTESQQGAFFVR